MASKAKLDKVARAYLEADAALKHAQDAYDEAKADAIETIGIGNNHELDDAKLTIVQQSQTIYLGEVLEEKLTRYRWYQISERRYIREKLKAAVELGQIPDDVLETATRTKKKSPYVNVYRKPG